MRTNIGCLITGKSGTGKSWYQGWLVEVVRKRLVILDPKDEHVGLAKQRILVDRRAFEAMAAMGHHVAWKRILQRHHSIRIRTDGLDLDEQLRMVDGLAQAIHELGDTCLAADEYHRYAPNGRVPRWVQILHTDARTHGIDWVVATQRPALLDTTTASQANRRVTFRMDDPNDLKRTGPYFHAEGGRPAAEIIAGLPPRRCLHLDCDTGLQELVDTTQLRRVVTHHG